MQYSKTIKKSDDSSKEFIIQCLKGDKTYGFDIDSIYIYHNINDDKYYIFEYLKCESVKVSPHQSEPKYYPYNWRKFHSLFQLAKKLNGVLILVNYSDGYKQEKINGQIQVIELPNKDRYKNEVRLLYVDNINYKLLQQYESSQNKPLYLDYISYSKDEKLTLEEFSTRLRKFNTNCGCCEINWELLTK
ncbi:hypothetical protein [Campylobacter novaezeelandiae]|uniref:hypothetical protein n=1 Tax=Campylobacter novaezeelandiae TaxID=2267891 RepID=UPI001906A0A1|nr:hypothetical protein [Campylobacter novaezeelandiae]MBK1963553.1 hypothetical protein [Campylobacter novaezeelandiae]MBK1993116.1 hypothetical protein [Campylobacter novaezeelandiae]